MKTLDLNNGEIFNTDEQITEEALKETSCSIFPVGTVLVAMYGGFNQIGRTGLLKVPAAINQALSGLVLDSKKVSPEFLINYLNGNVKVWKKFAASSRKDPNITREDVCGFPVLIPPLPEQKKIAQILSTWDKAITTTEQLLANSQQQKKALMQQLLTGPHPSKPRLLDKNGVRFSGEWKITTLSQMGKVVSGGTPDTNTKEYWDGDILWLTPTDVTALKSRFVRTTTRTISEAGVKNSSATILPAGSLMVCTRATIGALSISSGPICTNQGFKNIIPTKAFDVNFIYYLLAYNSKALLRKASGSTFLELSKKDFEKMEFPCPLMEEQQKIAAVLSAADQEISALQQKLDALKQEKKALMQQLLTGKRRVNTAEEEMA
ncbi:MAG: restriction endonuclease subunit S [Oceanospirillaceae bacterium]|nr:restriction endonuclease subunit S [Oceanospirillaceae bacterium]MAX99818.1 restriction endonuclease subunit S [Oceanospirillaceae bacterium]MBS53733.1 restriction endonuclease subunit S [Oceanospirillaceae bacterium]